MKEHLERHSFPFILFLAIFLCFLGAAFALGDDQHAEAQRLHDRYAIHGTYDPRIHSPSPQAGMIDLWQPEREREAPIDYRLSQPEPQRLGEKDQ